MIYNKFDLKYIEGILHTVFVLNLATLYDSLIRL